MSDKYPLKILISCEHSTNRVPKAYKDWFKGAEKDLSGHLGWDPGALKLAKQVGRLLKVTPFEGEVSRLLIDLNRSEDSPFSFSKHSKKMSQEEKEKVLNSYHRSYWQKVRRRIQGLTRSYGVLHLGIHSFTPIYKGKKRTTDIGLLYDPARSCERHLCLRWQNALVRNSDFKIHRNRPYLGSGNGLITSLRQEFPPRDYIGIEVEVNQSLLSDASSIKAIAQVLISTLN